MKHKAGYVNIIGHPNVGKSTLMNTLLGDRLSIVTSKPQTTRHRILGIYNDEKHQIVFSDTPGIINEPSYGMQESMNAFALSTLRDADLMMFIIDPFNEYTADHPLIAALVKRTYPLILVLNKSDLKPPEELNKILEEVQSLVHPEESVIISALHQNGTTELLNKLFFYLPEHPPYYPKDQLSDRNLRFFVSEIIREKLMEQFKQEIPYSCEVVVDEFQEKEKYELNLTKIYASIYVNRKSQKSILIGKGGSAIKKLGINARESIENFLDEQIYLELKVKVKDNWRDDERTLKHFGY